jgi:hypothetical protein
MDSDRQVLSRPVQLVITLLPIITASLYVIGRGVYTGYVKSFGLDESLFPLTVDDVLFQGFLVSLKIVLQPSVDLLGIVVLILIGGVGYSMVFGIFPNLRSAINDAIDEFFAKLKSEEEVVLPKLLRRVFNAVNKFGFYLIVSVIALFAVGNAYIEAEKIGKQSYREFKESSAKGEGRNAVLVTLKANKVTFLANSITCGSQHCAYLVDGQAVVFRHEDVSRTSAIPKATGKTSVPAAQSPGAGSGALPKSNPEKP